MCQNALAVYRRLRGCRVKKYNYKIGYDFFLEILFFSGNLIIRPHLHRHFALAQKGSQVFAVIRNPDLYLLYHRQYEENCH
mgnify:CR=1 FL=1